MSNVESQMVRDTALAFETSTRTCVCVCVCLSDGLRVLHSCYVYLKQANIYFHVREIPLYFGTLLHNNPFMASKLAHIYFTSDQIIC